MTTESNIEIIGSESPLYPAMLRNIPGPPEKIFLRGSAIADTDKKVAIVGTRRATAAGMRIAEEIASCLAARGLTIVSGLAMGIDAAAHRGALKANGKTIAVLGNGIDHIYPQINESLGNEILASGGTIISEYPPGTPGYPGNFLARNRIVSGLTLAVIVVEAPERSGSLATARAAAEQGREVFVLPGPVSHPNYRGSHALIRDGARLVASAEDVLTDLGMDTVETTAGTESDLTPAESAIRAALLHAGCGLNIDKITELTMLDPQTVNIALAILALKGLVKEGNGLYEL